MKASLRILLVLLLLGGAGVRPGAAQMTMSPAPAASGVLPHIALRADVLTGLPRRTITVMEDGVSVTYSGVELGALLAKNGAPQGSTLRGPAAADYAVLRASDGYR